MNLHSPSTNQVTKSRRQKICLAMIVKDDAPEVLARCLASVRPLIDYWIIVDSSTNGTPDVARRVLHDIPGELHQRPWVDFGRAGCLGIVGVEYHRLGRWLPRE